MLLQDPQIRFLGSLGSICFSYIYYIHYNQKLHLQHRQPMREELDGGLQYLLPPNIKRVLFCPTALEFGNLSYLPRQKCFNHYSKQIVSIIRAICLKDFLERLLTRHTQRMLARKAAYHTALPRLGCEVQMYIFDVLLSFMYFPIDFWHDFK